jgi:hypothetical protein
VATTQQDKTGSPSRKASLVVSENPRYKAKRPSTIAGAYLRKPSKNLTSAVMPAQNKKIPKIPKEQLELPVSVRSNGRFVTLADVLSAKHIAIPLTSLSEEKRAKLTIKRIKAQPNFEIAMIDAGVINKKRAIQEINARSDIGMTLIEIEQHVMAHVLSLIEK